MRFLILTQYFPPEIGAAQVRLAALIRELLRAGHQVEVVTALPNYPIGHIFPDYCNRFYQMDTWETIKIHRVWLYAATGAGMKRLFNYFSFVFTALYGLIKAEKPDYLFVESPPLFLGITAYIAAKWWRVPFIFNVADLWPDSVKALNLMQDGFSLRQAEKLESWIYKKASYINAVTEGIYQTLIQQKRVPASKVLFLPNGVATDLFKPYPVDSAWRASLNLPSDKPIILYAGTHGYAHGMDVIIETANLLRESNLLFLLVGDGSEKKRLQHLCQKRKLTNVIFWAPQPPEMIARLYSVAVAGLSTLRNAPLFEGTRPAKILAIMACSKPVLYSGSGEGAKLVAEAEAGIVIPPEEATALAEAVQRIITDKPYAERLGHNGRIYVETHLQWSTVVANWLQQLL